MTANELLVAPFAEFGFMRRALAACCALGLGSGPIGIFLLLRRMSLVGDAMSHAVLPGAAVGFFVAGLSLPAMGIGGVAAGLLVAVLSGLVSRTTTLREDASFASFYLMSLALGVFVISLRGSSVDLLHVLFGSILAIDTTALFMIASITTLTVLGLAVIYRPLVVECFDPGFLRSVAGRGSLYHQIFLLLLVLNLVASFQALGTLMAVGLMMLPATIAQLWVRSLPALFTVATLSALVSGYVGLVISFQFGIASGPTIILVAAALYAGSLVFAPAGVLGRNKTGFHFAKRSGR